jgi:flagellar basal-body rod protein FlgB
MSKVTLGSDDAALALKRMLDRSAARQKVAARNLANSATEGYRPKKVEFASELDRALGRVVITRTNPHHMSSRSTAGSEEFAEVIDEDVQDGDDARLERTVAELADAEMAYATAARLMSKRIAILRTAITGRP